MPDWSTRFVRLPADRNRWFFAWKMTTRMTRPTTTGSTPLSPLRIFFHWPRRYSPKLSATSSLPATRSTSAAVASGAVAAPESAAVRGSVVAMPSVLSAVGRCRSCQPAGGDELDRPLGVELGDRVDARDPPQVERGNAVGALE